MWICWYGGLVNSLNVDRFIYLFISFYIKTYRETFIQNIKSISANCVLCFKYYLQWRSLILVKCLDYINLTWKFKTKKVENKWGKYFTHTKSSLFQIEILKEKVEEICWETIELRVGALSFKMSDYNVKWKYFGEKA